MIGVLPETWTAAKLSDICQINPRGKSGLKEDDEVSFVPMAAVSEFSGTIVGAEKRLLRAVQKGFTPFQEGDVLFAKITPCMENGKAAIARNLVNQRGYGSTEFHVIRPSALVLAEWIFAIIRTAEFRRAAASSFQGAVGQQRVTASFLEQFRIPLPPLSEQQRIVGILQEAEAICRLRAEAEAKTAELIPAIFDAALAKGGVSRKRPLGHWFETKPNYGTMTPADEVTGSDGVVCLRVGNIQKNRIDLSDRKYVERSTIHPDRHTVRTGDIVLARAIASEEHLGKAVVITSEEDGFAFDSHLMRIRLRKAELVPEFLQVYLYSAQGRNAFLKQARQSAVQFNVNAEEMARVLVPDVDPGEQMDVVEAIKETESICKVLEASAAQSSLMFASLSANAFTGQLTSEWRKARTDQLALEVRERDAALKKSGATFIQFRRDTIQEMERVIEQRTDGVYSDLNNEQRDLLVCIRQRDLAARPARYFSAESLSQLLVGPLRRNPQAIEGHLAVLAARGLVIPVSRELQTEDTGEFVFGNAYRLPLRGHTVTLTDELGDPRTELFANEGEPGDYSRGRELERLAAQLEKERTLP